MKTERLIGILSVLLQKDKVTAPELAEMFEVSRRTISRDIDALCLAGIPVATSQGTGGGIRIMDGYRIDRTILTNKEMQALLAGLRGLDSVSGTGRYRQLMEKLSAGSADLMRADQNILINLASWDRAAAAEKFELIRASAVNRHKLTFHYSSPSGESVRTIEPYYLIFEWSGWYVWGWCETREAFRLFKLNRMTDLHAGESFAAREAPFPDLSNEAVFPQRHIVKAKVRPEYRWRILDEYGPESFEEQPDGTLLFSFGFSDEAGIISWVLSFQDGIELLEPADLREKLRVIGENLSARYR